ncbi:MAG: hypothetical protein A2W05_07160 [Candidatus Schekmanbacteria bacterium RBG_16_38_10]|uniref:Uncharacterized protein n=1 Tax=Candidatus Schekmanbacteria bacterium RBG_16_38_10 TaxID=1817879 RepID=A0A1F7RY27_9BACT|nr:MAG: hypothetical protein A2W05_07160 [Candidatus Schekmanbacteria bacterium RBG_16_38_10]
MYIPKEYLKESTYSGTRLIEITDEKVIELKKEISKFKPIAEPYLKEMDRLGELLDPFYTKIRELEAEKDKLVKERQPNLDLFNAQLKEMEAIEQKTDLIKNKIQPLVARLMEKELGEFETARQLIEQGDKLFVEVVEEVEELVKRIRMKKNKK